MKIIFVELRGTSKQPHNGLAYLAGNVSSDHEVKIFDLNVLDISEEELVRRLQKENPDLLCFAMKSFGVKKILSLAKRLKLTVKSKFVVGGPHITLYAEEFFNNDNDDIFDFGFHGESDLSFAKFCDVFGEQKKYSEISGLIYKNNEGEVVFNENKPVVDLDEIKFPNFDCFEKQLDFEKYGGYQLSTSRGCPYKCIYCSVPKVSGMKWRFRSPENVLDEIKEAVQKYNIKSFQIVDDNFSLDIDRAKKFCRLLIKQGLNLRWRCPNGLRADCLDEEFAILMKKSGCNEVSLGIESGDKKVFDFINKGEKLDDIANAVKILKKHDFIVSGFFIVGLPFETPKSVKRSLELIDNLQLDGAKWGMLVPYPKTFLWDWVLENGRFFKEFTDGQHYSKEEGVRPVFETKDYSAQQMIKSYKIANLSVGSYYYVFQRTKSNILFYLQYALYLLWYNPFLLLKKIFRKVKKTIIFQK